MERDFNNWLAQFRTSIANYQYYTDFDKVFANVDAIKVELNILNSLIGSRNIKEDFMAATAHGGSCKHSQYGKQERQKRAAQYAIH